MMRPYIFSLALACAALMTGCVQPGPGGNHVTPDTLPVNLTGYPPAFREGYAAGCNSARGRDRHDAARMAADALYAQGYHDGYDGCRRT